MKKIFFLVLSCCFIITSINAQNDYTVSGGLLGAANFSKFKITENNHNSADYETKTGWSLGGWVNFPVSNAFSIEPQLLYSSYRYFTPTTTNVLIQDGKIKFVSVPLLFKLHAGDRFAFSIGPQFDFMTSVENESGSMAMEDDFEQTSVSGSFGVEILPHGRLTIFGRYLHGFTDMNALEDATAPEYKNRNFQVGLKLKLFGSKRTTYQATTPPLPVDSDGDGIADDVDKCPNEPGTAKYDGCPVPDSDGDGINDELDKCPNEAGLAKYDGCPIPDSDGDGINDEEDKCPNEAGLAKYDGCPIPDRDGDGINDEEDKCPDTPGIAANDGCPEVREVGDKVSGSFSANARNIQFTGTSATLTTRSHTSLNNIVTMLNEDPELKVKIEGHTDNVGDDDKNMELSEERAEAVKVYLVSKGISEDRISTEGFGETMPIADNNTAAGRTKNRRVEIKVSY